MEATSAGRLQGIVVAELIRELHRERRTGILEIRNSWITKRIFFDEGRIVQADSDAPDDRLGEILVRDGVASIEQIEAANSFRSPARLAAGLEGSGALGREAIERARRSRARSIVADLMREEEGEYEFREGPLPEDAERLDLDTEDLIVHGVRNLRSFRMLRRGVGSPRTRYRVVPEWRRKLERVDLRDGERVLLERLDEGPESIEGLCAALSISDFEIYQALWAFRLLDSVERYPDLSASDARLVGQLDREEFLAVLVRLCREGETGMLRVSRRAVDRTFQIREGRCVFATSNDPDDGLVAHLFRRGVISLKDMEEVSRRLLTNKRVGTILLELGALDEEDVGRMVREQIGEIVNSTARWDSGEYSFTPGELPTLEEITLDFSLEDLVVQAVRRIPSGSRAVAALGGPDALLEVSPRYLDILDRMTVGGDEWDVVALLARPRTVREVCRASGIGDFRVCQTLWSLQLLGALQAAAPAAVATDPAPIPAPPAAVLDAPPQAVAAIEPPAASIAPAIEVPPEWTEERALREETGETPESEVVVTFDEEPSLLAEPDVELLPAVQAVLEEPTQPLPETPQFELDAPGCETEPFIGDMRPMASKGASPARAAASDEAERRPLDGDSERQIEWLNACQQIVYRAVRSEVGAGAANFIRFCGARVPEGFGELFAHVELADDGTWDVFGLRKALRNAPQPDLHGGFRRLLDKEVEMVQVHLGAEHAEALRRKIDEFEKAGAA